MMPNKTMSFQKETCSGGKLSKERITILVGANSDGSEKLPLLVIGRALKPRCFKNVNSLPVLYKANKKAWMTFHLWEEYIRRLDKKFAKNNRKIIFIVDNAPCHLPISGLQAITIANFPANTTAILQPMDQGVIKNFKGFYRELLVKKIIATIEDDSCTTAQQVKINLLDALHMAQKSWEKIKPETILNCFRKARFHNALDISSPLTISSPLISIWNNPTIDQITDGIDSNSYISVDQYVETSEDLTDDDLIQLTTVTCVSDSESSITATLKMSMAKLTSRHCFKLNSLSIV